MAGGRSDVVQHRRESLVGVGRDALPLVLFQCTTEGESLHLLENSQWLIGDFFFAELEFPVAVDPLGSTRRALPLIRR